jgi:hypothetical protein
MNKFLFACAFMTFTAGYGAHAQDIIAVSGAQPTNGALDIVNYGNIIGGNGGTDYTNNANGSGAPGQTFTATSNGLLTGITLQGNGTAGSGSSFQSMDYGFYVYQVGTDGTTLSELTGANDFTFSDQDTNDNIAGDYFTFTLSTPIQLTAGVVYAFTFAEVPNGTNSYLGLADDSASSYTDGTSFSGNNNQGASQDPFYSTSINSTQPDNHTFAAHIEAVPEPSTWAMLAGGLVMLAAWQRRRQLS